MSAAALTPAMTKSLLYTTAGASAAAGVTAGVSAANGIVIKSQEVKAKEQDMASSVPGAVHIPQSS